MLNDQRRALYREIDIMDAGNTDVDHTEVFPTTVFSTWVRNPPTSSKQEVQHRLCEFCESDHQGECNVRDITTRISIVKKKGLCFNC